jgi:hypothetical protein
MQVPTKQILEVVSVEIPIEPMCTSMVFSREFEIQASRQCVHVDAREEVPAFFAFVGSVANLLGKLRTAVPQDLIATVRWMQSCTLTYPGIYDWSVKM